MHSTTTVTILYYWHLLDSLTHLLFESTYIYNCFTSYITVPLSTPTPSYVFLGQHGRLYGNAYAENLFGAASRIYAKADSRYSGIDLTTLSLEIITVFLAGPLALYIASSISRDAKRSGLIRGHTWLWATILATAELYGGYVLLPSLLAFHHTPD